MDVPVLEVQPGDTFPYEYDRVLYYVTVRMKPEIFTDRFGREMVRLWSSHDRDEDLQGFMEFSPQSVVKGVMRSSEG